MAWGSERRARPSRIERQAYTWVARMIDDPDRHEEGLARWIGGDPERLDVYNRVARAMKAATWSATQLYERRQTRPARGFRGVSDARWAMALVAIGLAAAAIAIAHLISPEAQPDTQLLPASAFDAPANGERMVVLADGSRVTLRAGSHIETHFSHTDRRIILVRGSARFQVAHNANWPFIVSAGGGSVTAKGTVFDVTVGPEISVRLIEGAVDVSLPAQAHEKPIVRHLSVGAEMRFPASGSTNSTDLKPHGAMAVETSDVRSFDDVPVRDVIDEVNRTAPVRIELADAAMGNQRVVLDLHVGDAEDVADGLSAYLGLIVDRSQPGILLLRTPVRH